MNPRSGMLAKSIGALCMVAGLALGAQAAAPTFENDSASARLVAKGPCKVGAACPLELTIDTKGAFTFNPLYQLKVKVSSTSAGVTFSKVLLKLADASTSTATRVVFPLSIYPTSAGQALASTTVFFSVRGEAASRTAMDTIDLELAVKVTP